MAMNMHHALQGIGSTVEHHAVTCLADAENFGNRGGSKKNMASHLFVFRRKMAEGDYMAERDDEGVMWCGRSNVAKSQHMFIAVDDVGRDAPSTIRQKMQSGSYCIILSPLLFNG